MDNNVKEVKSFTTPDKIGGIVVNSMEATDFVSININCRNISYFTQQHVYLTGSSLFLNIMSTFFYKHY